MYRDETFDVAIVGGGLAGLTVAARASESGLSTIVIETGEEERYPCNSRYSGGILHFAYHDVQSSPESLAAVVKNAMGREGRPELIEAAARMSGPAVDWLSRFDVRFIRSSPMQWHRWTLAPPRPLQPGLDFPGSGPDRLLKSMTSAVRQRNGAVLLGCRAVDLEGDNDSWTLELVGREGRCRIGARVVVLADGGFQGDAELVRHYVSARPDLIVQRGAGTGRGFAVRMATKLGCGLSRMDRFYGHVLSRDALTNAGLWPYPQLDPLATAGIVVGPDAKRFVDEGKGGVFIANAIAGLANPAGSVAIIDQAIWERAGRQSLYPPNPHLEDAGGTLNRAATLRELAESCGLDPRALERTVAEYNSAVDAGPNALSGLEVSRSADPAAIRGPFIGIPLVAGITNTMGGLMVDAGARVLDLNGAPMNGLYAVGACAGGLEGGSNVGYVGGLMRALTSGLLAADDIVGRLGPVAGSQSAHQPALDNDLDPVSSDDRPTVPSPRSNPAVLRILARHPIAISATASAIAFAIVLVLAWPVIASVALLPALGIGATVFVLAKAFCELAAIVLDVLVPG